jgi:hypothetical protein
MCLVYCSSFVSDIWIEGDKTGVRLMLIVGLESQSQSYSTTGGLLPISSSWRQASWDLRHSNFIFQLNTCGNSPYVTSSLTRGWIGCRQYRYHILYYVTCTFNMDFISYKYIVPFSPSKKENGIQYINKCTEILNLKLWKMNIPIEFQQCICWNQRS